jgi:hypothetical protein
MTECSQRYFYTMLDTINLIIYVRWEKIRYAYTKM